MGPGESASQKEMDVAYKLGLLLASKDYIVLTGGRNCGVMEAALKGAKSANGLTLGILPGVNKQFQSNFVDISIVTGLNQARNQINILTSDIVIAVGLGPGTLSEIALAIKYEKKVIVFNTDEHVNNFFKTQFREKIIYISSIPEFESVLKEMSI